MTSSQPASTSSPDIKLKGVPPDWWYSAKKHLRFFLRRHYPHQVKGSKLLASSQPVITSSPAGFIIALSRRIVNSYYPLIVCEKDEKWIKDACISYMGEHVFRHTFQANCYHKGADVKILSRLLGHADVNITYNIYVHLYGDGFDEM